MSNASQRNFAAAVNERDLRQARLNEGEDPFTLAQANYLGPAWDAVYGSLRQKAQDANNAGLGFSVNLSGLGRDGRDFADGGGGLQYPSNQGMQQMNAAADAANTQNKIQNLAISSALDAKDQANRDAMRKSYDDQVAASINAPPITDRVVQTYGPGGKTTYSTQPRSTDPRQQFLDRLPPAARLQAEQQMAATTASQANTALTNADVTAKTGAGTLPDYLMRTAAAAGKKLSDLTPEEVNKAREDYLSTTAMAGVQGPKVQQALEQQYRGVLQKQMSSRSGGLGTEDQKVNQAIHLMALMNQNKDPKTGDYNVPKSQYAELASGLATLVSPNGRPTDSMRTEIEQRTAKGDFNGALTYITGTPLTGSTQEIFKMLHDSIDRQGRVAQANRQKYLDDLRAQAPTDLSPSRRAALEQALNMNSLDDPQAGGAPARTGAPAGAAGPAGGAVPMFAPDGRQLMVPAGDVNRMLALGAKKAGG